jgi:PEGA domain-containing protein
MSRVIAVVACGFTLAACSSSISSWNFLKSAPQTEALHIESEPPGADAKISGGQSCRTPCEVTVQSGGELSVTLSLNGYQPQTVSVRPEAPPSGQRDADGFATTAKLAPNPVYVELQPALATPAAKKPVAKRKKPVAAARPAASPAPTTTASVPPPAPPPPPMPAASPEPAASATNYPWPSR